MSLYEFGHALWLWAYYGKAQVRDYSDVHDKVKHRVNVEWKRATGGK